MENGRCVRITIPLDYNIPLKQGTKYKFALSARDHNDNVKKLKLSTPYPLPQ